MVTPGPHKALVSYFHHAVLSPQITDVRLIGMRPRVIALFNEITESVPLDFPKRDRASQPDFLVPQGHYLPVPPTGPGIDV